MGRRAPAGRFKLPTLRPQDIEDHPSASRAPASVKIKVYGPIGESRSRPTHPDSKQQQHHQHQSRSRNGRLRHWSAPLPIWHPRPHSLLTRLATASAATEMAPTEMAPTEMAPTEMAPTEMAPTEMAPTPMGRAMYEDHGGFDHGFRQDTPPPIIEPCPLETYESQNVEQMTEDQLRSELAPVITPTQTRERLETTYSAFLTREARLRKFERPRLFVQYLSFMIDSNSRLNPRIIEVEVEKGITLFTVADKVPLRPCECEGTITRCILVHGATSRFPLDVLQLVESCWAVDPSSVEGMAQGMDDYYEKMRVGRFRSAVTSSISLDEFRALAAHEAEFNDRLLNIKDSYAYKCPACFGPTILNQPNQAPKLDHLIAIDGNFQQWRNQAAKHDPQATTPDLFISAAEISEMKEAVEKNEDSLQEESWKAADDGAEKFWAGKSDTGLVACVCRHDVVLKMVNLEKSGKKRVGPEAKIGKRELLPELAPRLEFAASVFHAFAHQWSCQVEFNPQLISNFGCTDAKDANVFGALFAPLFRSIVPRPARIAWTMWHVDQ
ncbi:BQ2448_3 [Microbotryum intermedium]|uniref:BQ2448_3 protein n=1 Tax=Microbotryum intermedium TaxID=269621 RepID=A0A238FGG1_9BASI|nr:BQ2448_3 [Microbotryum intermedium]